MMTSVAALALAAVSAPATAQVRVPAEWEPHQATWMQWPYGWEITYRPNFAAIIDGIEDYEPVRLLVKNEAQRADAEDYLADRGVPLHNVEFIVRPIDNAWMRDNGPVWVERAGDLWAQDFRFDGWGEKVPGYASDDDIPCFVASLTASGCFSIDALILERGGLEFNGEGVLITAWPWLHSRNPWLTKEKAEAGFSRVWGIDQVIWLDAVPEEDRTGGHVDGIARFIDADTVVVARYVDESDPMAWVYEAAATQIAAAGMEVIRIDIPGKVPYFGGAMEANYVNWLVGNGVVVVTGFDHPEWDTAAKAQIETFFPGRDVVVVDAREIWSWGGGVHCVTNDQPLL
jgi:agmatine deiminase